MTKIKEMSKRQRKVLDAIGKVTKYEITPDGKMAFKSADGTTVMKLEKK